jgi:DNA-binding transcriptional LysR family regulator
LHVALAEPAAGGLQPLRERRLDLMLARWISSRTDDDLLAETLLENSFTVVTRAASPWARRKKVELAELMDEPWLYSEPGNTVQARISEVILARCGRLPLVGVYAVAMSVRLALLALSGHVSCIPTSVYRHGVQGQPIKGLPIDMGLKVPIAMISLNERTLSPAVQVFIEGARQVAQEMAREA